MIDTAVILAGGRGMRLMPDTSDKPKAMVSIAGRPLIMWIIAWLRSNRVTNIIVSMDYQQHVLRKFLSSEKELGVHIIFNDHSGCEETGDAFRSVFKNIELPETFLAMNGDQIIDMDISQLSAHHASRNSLATIVTCPVRIPYGIVEASENHTIKAFHEKPIREDILMNTGIYVFNKKIQKHLPERGAIERTTFSALAPQNGLASYIHRGFFHTINTRKDLEEAENALKSYKPVHFTV